MVDMDVISEKKTCHACMDLKNLNHRCPIIVKPFEISCIINQRNTCVPLLEKIVRAT